MGDLCSRLSGYYRQRIVEEYPKLKKSDREKVKDKGGLMVASLKIIAANRNRRLPFNADDDLVKLKLVLLKDSAQHVICCRTLYDAWHIPESQE
jgi:hypothetical protein